jgi:hypothetical protein
MKCAPFVAAKANVSEANVKLATRAAEATMNGTNRMLDTTIALMSAK